MISRSVLRPFVRSSARANVCRASQANFPRFVSSAVGRKTAIVTGSGRGIGKAIALRLASDGYDLCINDVLANKSSVDEVVDEVRSTYSRKAIPFLADVSKLQQVEAMVEESTKQLGPLNVMVANAGIAQVKPLLDLTEEDLKRIFDVNLFGTYNCYRAAARKMIAQGDGGKLLGCVSIAGFKPFPLLSHYSATKSAVRSLTQGLAMEIAKHKITVNAYAPGIVGTAMWDLVDEKLGERTGARKGDTIKKYTEELIALGRTSVPEDVSGVVSFLCGPDSDYMTGQTVVVDGGIIFN